MLKKTTAIFLLFFSFCSVASSDSLSDASSATPAGNTHSDSELESRNIPKYNRGSWKHWIDEDRDCQYTRDEVLVNTSESLVRYKTHRGCKVRGGTWYDPYNGRYFHASTDLHIDHIVPLKLAHQYGGWAWSREKKKAFANDSENLIAVDAGTNRRKNGKGPADWMPKNEDHWCRFAETWQHILTKYGLNPSDRDQRKLEQVLENCR